MSKPLTIDEILGKYWSSGIDWSQTGGDYEEYSKAEAKAQIEAMIADIIGEDDWHGDLANGYRRSSVDTVRNDLRAEARKRATKYNLTLKEGK